MVDASRPRCPIEKTKVLPDKTRTVKPRPLNPEALNPKPLNPKLLSPKHYETDTGDIWRCGV